MLPYRKKLKLLGHISIVRNSIIRDTYIILSQGLSFFFIIELWHLINGCRASVPDESSRCLQRLLSCCNTKNKWMYLSHSRLSLLIKRNCSLPFPTMIGLDHYNRSVMWLLKEFMETEQGSWNPAHGFPLRWSHTSQCWRSVVYVSYRFQLYQNCPSGSFDSKNATLTYYYLLEPGWSKKWYMDQQYCIYWSFLEMPTLEPHLKPTESKPAF